MVVSLASSDRNTRLSPSREKGGGQRGLTSVDWNKDRAVVDFVYAAWEGRQRSKEPYEQLWAEQVAWVAGEQTKFWDETRRALRKTSAPPWRVRMVINKLVGIVQTITAKVTRHKPNFDTKPLTTEYSDIAAARLARKLLVGYWQTLGGSERLEEALIWTLCTGNVFIKSLWDPGAGTQRQVSPYELAGPENGDPQAYERALLGAAGDLGRMTGRVGRRPSMDKLRVPVGMGDLAIEVASPFDILVDPEAGSLEPTDCDWLLHSKRRSLYYLHKRYGRRAKELKAQSVEVDDPKWARHYGDKYKGTESKFGSDRATVHELHIPILDGIKNQVFVVCQEKVIAKSKAPMHDGRFPFRHLKEIPVPGRFWGTSTVEQCMYLQAEYNQGRSHIVEARNLMGNPKWLVAQQANIAGNSITNEPGEIIRYNFTYKPEMLNPPPLPRYILETVGMADKDMQDVSGQHEVSKGKVPGEVRSGTAIQQLIGQDDTRIGLFGRRLDVVIGQVGQDLLELLTLNASEYRTLRVVGENERLDMLYFTGADLMGGRGERAEQLPHDVRVTTWSQLPMSREGIFNQMLTLIQNKILTEADRPLILEALDMGTAMNVFDKRQEHRSRAQNENLQMAQGEKVLAQRIEHHPTHLEIHSEFRNGEEYRQLPMQIRVLFEFHQRMHEKLLAAEMVRPQVQLMEAMASEKAKLMSPKQPGTMQPDPALEGPPGPPGGGPRGPGGPPKGAPGPGGGGQITPQAVLGP